MPKRRPRPLDPGDRVRVTWTKAESVSAEVVRVVEHAIYGPLVDVLLPDGSETRVVRDRVKKTTQ
ncbi:MAG: hypothetical protein AAGD00_04710 [Planctomycetota bacterium]